jgi:hypothetical protein
MGRWTSLLQSIEATSALSQVFSEETTAQVA